MNAACKSSHWDSPSISRVGLAVARADDTQKGPAHVIVDVMQKAATCRDLPAVLQLLRCEGPALVEAFGALNPKQSGQSNVPSLESKLRDRGVSQTVLDNLEHSRLHFRRGVLLFNDIRNSHQPDQVPESVRQRMEECVKSQWQHLFGWVFLSCIAEGLIAPDASGVEPMLVFMRAASRQVYVHAVIADEDLRDAA